MGKDSFTFRQFEVHQHLCAMKVGTDGTLLGAWAQIPVKAQRILDIGTGTGLIALMMAQRFPEAKIVAIDIDEDAVNQARQNVSNSKFCHQISVIKTDVSEVGEEMGTFDAIVSNPPFFIDSLTSPDQKRTTARHTLSLSYKTLMQTAAKLLTKGGLLSMIIPFETSNTLMSEAASEGLMVTRIYKVKTTPQKHPKRLLIEFSNIPAKDVIVEEVVLEDQPSVRSSWYQSLTNDFYVK